MNDTLLVRVYNVGFGDCIYIRVPDKHDSYHILIDCGTAGPAEPVLEDAVANLRSLLPDHEDPEAPAPSSQKRLDLLVATHPHADHIKGFDPDWFEGIHIRHIWLSSFMEEGHPQTKNALTLQALADRAASALLAQGLRLERGLDTLLSNALSNPRALTALKTTLPQRSGISPLYMSRDAADPTKDRIDPTELAKHRLQFEEGTTCLRDFREDETCVRVLAPEWDIDGYYLGKGVADYQALLAYHDDTQAGTGDSPKRGPVRPPPNISARDFRLLRHRLQYSALAFAHSDQALKNNTSIVLLLEWRGRRLLFAADAEFRGSYVGEGRRNSCWDVLLKMDEQPGHLAKPLDLLKVGHHGSVNASPFFDEEDAVQTFLDQMLPEGGKAQVVVTTLAGKHGKKKKVPYASLMQELGRRAGNARVYPDEPELLQPQRTDKENDPWVDILIKPVAD